MVSLLRKPPAAAASGHADGAWYGFLHDGVNFSIPGTGGDDCVAFIPATQKLVETCAAIALAAAGLWYARSRVHFPPALPPARPGGSGLQQAILVALCLTFGVEVGYKLTTRTVIWLVNPCHLLTVAQIVLLAAPSDGRRAWVTALFRLQMHSLHGAFVALLLPVTNTRELPFEIVVYYVQHALIVAIPCFLLAKGGAYTVEPLHDLSWCAASHALLLFAYFVPVQALALATGVNLNNMLCPAISDPFYGVCYRQWAIGHSTLAIFAFGKLYTLLASTFVSLLSPPSCSRPLDGTERAATATNGHAKGL